MDILIRFDYIVEILLAEWVFVHIYPKRRCFFVRLLVTTAVSLACLLYTSPSPRDA